MEQIRLFFDALSRLIEMHVVHRVENFRIIDIFDIVILACVFFFAIKFTSFYAKSIEFLYKYYHYTIINYFCQ